MMRNKWLTIGGLNELPVSIKNVGDGARAPSSELSGGLEQTRR